MKPVRDPPQQILHTEAASSAWSPFRHAVFRRLWIASVIANIGGWIYNAAAGWMMTGLDAGPLMVSLVQVATSLPMFLFALPAGALADIIDKRRFILVLEILIAFVAGLFAILVSADRATPWTLLLFTFLIGTVEALEAPSWQSIVPQLVPKQDLSPAIAANSVGINISRAIGPALAGVIIAAFGIAAPFWLVAISNFGVIGVCGGNHRKCVHAPCRRKESSVLSVLAFATPATIAFCVRPWLAPSDFSSLPALTGLCFRL